MGKGWIAAEGKLDLYDEGRTDWPAAEIARAGPENIRVLDLDGNWLTAIPGEQLARLSRLERLRLRSNQLTAIPAVVGRLSALKELVVGGNRLTAIPAEVWQLSALQYLNVENNQLTAIPAEVGRLSALEQLYVGNNRLTAIPAEVGRLSALQVLSVHVNQLTAIPAEVGRLSALQALSVGENRLTAIPAEVGRLPLLHTLYATPNPLTDLPASARVSDDAVLTFLRSLPPPAATAPAPPPPAPKPAPAPAPAPAPPTPSPPPAAASTAPTKAASPSPAGVQDFEGAPDFEAMKASQLKAWLLQRGVGIADCIERSDFVAKASRVWSAASGSGASSSPSPAKAASPSPAAAGRDPREMRVADVCEWLRALDLGKLAPAFEDCSVDGPMLLTLTDADLREELDVQSGLVRRKILTQIADLARPHGLPVAGPTAPPARPQSARARPPAPRHPPPARPAADGKSWDCFISYAHADAALVFRYCDTLEAAGLAIWVDRELKSGQKWMAEIGDAMGKCRTYICFLSPAYVASKNCDDEMQYAHHQLRLPKFPVWLVDPKGVELPTDYRMMLTAVNWTPQRGAGDAAADEAARALVAGLRAAGLPKRP